MFPQLYHAMAVGNSRRADAASCKVVLARAGACEASFPRISCLRAVQGCTPLAWAARSQLVPENGQLKAAADIPLSYEVVPRVDFGMAEGMKRSG